MEEINAIRLCSEEWHQITWGDFAETPDDSVNAPEDRPRFGENYFIRTMNQLRKNVLVRSHQPRIKPVIFDKKCITLMTSYAYTFTRLIAIADLEKPCISSADDLELLEI